ncbi:hypothetical protein [Curtobacterium sp. ISL-83]|uniref:hypothetical protein n=1 Tax=Curtobacterium sp. ISL-83 TaxID=2819145 RepID=UPI001BEC3BA4|nr:hypothetical protein [Curtobacterium sp. ISL-83]MBT2502641.1 hypothetical protein [Curtobacterium sp. ISL-83]
MSLTPIDSRTYRVTGTPRCGILETTCQVHVGNIGGDYHWNGGTSTATFASWPTGTTRTPQFWTYACIGTLCTNSARVNGSPVTRPHLIRALTASLAAQDDKARTARITGTASAGAVIKRNGQQVAVPSDSGSGAGSWGTTVTGLSVGQNTLTFQQVVGGTVQDQASVSVNIGAPPVPDDPESITGDDLWATVARGGTTTVSVTYTAKRAFTTPTGTIEFTAPEGARFVTGQDSVRGEYRDGSSWHSFGGDSLVNGVRSANGAKYTFGLGNRNWDVAKDQKFRFGLKVRTPADIATLESAMTGKLVGRVDGGTFDTTATTATIIPDQQLTAAATDVDADKLTAKVGGSAPFAATSVDVTWTRNGVSTTRTVRPSAGTWGVDLDALGAGGNTVHVEAFTGERSLGTVDVVVRIEVVAPVFDAVAQFDTDVTKQVRVGGRGTTGATVVIREGATELARTTVLPSGEWSVTIAAPNRGGVRTVDAIQMVSGQTDETVRVPIDYGVAVRVTSPGDGFVVSPVFPDVRIAGVAAAGAVVRLSEQGVPGSDLGTATADANGRWSVTTPPLAPRDQVVVATATSRGANTTTSTIALVTGP